MDQKKSDTIVRISQILSLLGMILAGLWFLDGRHAKEQVSLEARAELLDKEITRGSEIRIYYQNKEAAGLADPADIRRKEYIEEELERNYEQKAIIDKKLLEYDQ